MYLLHNIPIEIGKQRKGHKQRPYVQIHQENVSSIYSLHLSMHAKVNKLNIFLYKEMTRYKYIFLNRQKDTDFLQNETNWICYTEASRTHFNQQMISNASC